MGPTSYAAPTAQSERITILDSLRGFAIPGILLMNIASGLLNGRGAALPIGSGSRLEKDDRHCERYSIVIVIARRHDEAISCYSAFVMLEERSLSDWSSRRVFHTMKPGDFVTIETL